MTTPIVTAKTITFNQLVKLTEDLKVVVRKWVRTPDGFGSCEVTFYRPSGLVRSIREYRVTRLPKVASLEHQWK